MSNCCAEGPAYNSFAGSSQLPYEIVSYLMLNNEDLWKLLKYNDIKALSKPNLSLDEKGKMIWNGDGNKSGFHVFIDYNSMKHLTDIETSILRLTILRIRPNPQNVLSSIVDIGIQCIVHDELSLLSDKSPRVWRMFEEVMKTLNFAPIGIGGLRFDRNLSGFDEAYYNILNQTNDYKGVSLTISTEYSSVESRC